MFCNLLLLTTNASSSSTLETVVILSVAVMLAEVAVVTVVICEYQPCLVGISRPFVVFVQWVQCPERQHSGSRCRFCRNTKHEFYVFQLFFLGCIDTMVKHFEEMTMFTCGRSWLRTGL